MKKSDSISAYFDDNGIYMENSGQNARFFSKDIRKVKIPWKIIMSNFWAVN